MYFDGSAPTTPSTTIMGDHALNATGQPGTAQVGDGIDIDGSQSGTARVSHNTATSDFGNGIGVYGTAAAEVTSNTANKDGNGVFVGADPFTNVASSTNTVGRNVVNNNTNDGILADSTSAGNTFSSNAANNDRTYDYQDMSTGARTAGTDNTWSSDTCRPAADSSPEGLC